MSSTLLLRAVYNLPEIFERLAMESDQSQTGATIVFETNPILEPNVSVTDNTGLSYAEALTGCVNDIYSS